MRVFKTRHPSFGSLHILQNDFANRSDMICTAPGNDLQNRFTEENV